MPGNVILDDSVFYILWKINVVRLARSESSKKEAVRTALQSRPGM
jgi:hypothetical protein